jgi:predicted ATPase
MVSGGFSDTGQPPEFDPDGQNVPTFLDHLLRRDRKRFDEVVSVLRKLIDGFEDLQIGTPDPSTRQLDLRIESGLRIPANNCSVGVRLLLFFVALAYHPTPPRLILVEEPENGVHPKRLERIMLLLHEITRGVHANHAAQVVLTTHSPHLLDFVDLNTDQVLVFSRQEDGSRTAEPADTERLKTFLDEFMLGEVWYNKGEEGLVARKS